MLSDEFTTDRPLPPDLAVLEKQFEAIEREAADLLDGLSAEQRSWRPGGGRWSILDCLDHLNLVGYKVLRRLDRLIADARSQGLQALRPYRARLHARLFIAWLEPPYRMRAKVPRGYLGPPPEDPERVERELIELQSELIKRLYEANGLDFNRARTRSPANPRLVLSLGEWLAFLAAHERRHLWQARQVREHPGFPAGA